MRTLLLAAACAAWNISGEIVGREKPDEVPLIGGHLDLHHAADDTLDKVSPLELAQNVAVWTALLYTVADSDIDFRTFASEAK